MRILSNCCVGGSRCPPKRRCGYAGALSTVPRLRHPADPSAWIIGARLLCGIANVSVLLVLTVAIVGLEALSLAKNLALRLWKRDDRVMRIRATSVSVAGLVASGPFVVGGTIDTLCTGG